MATLLILFFSNFSLVKEKLYIKKTQRKNAKISDLL